MAQATMAPPGQFDLSDQWSPPPGVTPIVSRVMVDVPFQMGRQGFVRLGMGAPYVPDAEWEDGLFLCVSAGRWSGKSAAGALRHFMYVAAHPGSSNIIAVPDFQDFERSTRPALEKMFAACGLKLHEHFEYNETKRRYDYWNGARAWVLSLDDPEDARGPDVASVWVDEASNVVEKAFVNLVPTIRQPGFPHQFWLTMTPPGQSHFTFWLFEPERAFAEGFSDRQPLAIGEHKTRSVKDPQAGGFTDVHSYEYRLPEVVGHDGTTLEPGGHYVIMYAASRDNPHVSRVTLGNTLYILGGANSPQARRELSGEWVTLEGLIYPEFDPGQHVVPRDQWPSNPTRFVAGFDYGFGTRSAFIVIGLDDAGRIYLCEEFYQPKMDELTIQKIGLHLMKKYGIAMFFVDSAAPASISALKSAGLPAWGADKRNAKTASNPELGLGVVKWAISSRVVDPRTKEVTQRLYVDPSLKNFRAEIGSYIWEPQKKDHDAQERPRKMGDHILDALRYGLMGMVNRLHWLRIAREESLTMNFDLRITR